MRSRLVALDATEYRKATFAEGMTMAVFMGGYGVLGAQLTGALA